MRKKKNILTMLALLLTCQMLAYDVTAAEQTNPENSASSTEKVKDGYFTTPEGLTTIADRAYANNTKLIRVTIADGVRTIGTEAFADCTNLNYIFLPKSVEKLGKHVFKNCPKLFVHAESGISNKVIDQLYDQELQYRIASKGQKVFDSMGMAYPKVGSSERMNDIIYTVTKKTDTTREVTVRCVDMSSRTKVTIPATVKMAKKTYRVVGIEKRAFRHMKNVKTITIGKNVKKIDNQAFRNCKKLSTVKILSKNCRFSGKSIWKGTSKKLTVKVPKTVLKKMRERLKNTRLKKTAVKAL